MSFATSDFEQIEQEWRKDNDKWATAAVRGANNWLVTIRNATDEGIEPWSDDWVDGRNGIMSMSEGLTAIALLKQNAPTEDPRWHELRTEFHTHDMQKIIEQITAEDGPRFRSDPYMKNLDTNHFVPAATFSTSAVLESIVAGVNFGDGVTDDDIQEALETNVDWLLTNRIDDSYDCIDDDGAVGWAWIGSQADEYQGNETKISYYPRNYFTYSAVLVLTDLLRNQHHHIVESVVSPREKKIKAALGEAKTFLLNQYFEQGRWTYPSASLENNQEVLLSNCYTFVGLSYITTYVDEIDLSERAQERMASSMQWLLNTTERADVWTLTVEYDCGEEENGRFTDGSGPYVLLDAMLEVVNYRQKLLEMTEYELDEVKEKVDELVENILNYCWAGDARFTEKGFRHIKESDTLTNEEGDRNINPTTIYATAVAIETFLLNYLEEVELTQKDMTTVKESSEETATTASTTSPEDEHNTQETSKTNVIYIDESSGSQTGQIPRSEFREIKSAIDELKGEIKANIDRQSNKGDLELKVWRRTAEIQNGGRTLPEVEGKTLAPEKRATGDVVENRYDMLAHANFHDEFDVLEHGDSPNDYLLGDTDEGNIVEKHKKDFYDLLQELWHWNDDSYGRKFDSDTVEDYLKEALSKDFYPEYYEQLERLSDLSSAILEDETARKVAINILYIEHGFAQQLNEEYSGTPSEYFEWAREALDK